MARDRSMRGWHVARASRILRGHPEIRALQRPAPITGMLIILLVAIQSSSAVLAASLSWPWLIAAAWAVGAIPALGLFVLLHEGAHGLIVRSRRGNRALMIVSTAPLLLPWAAGFHHYHLEHHRALGNGVRDVDVPSAWEHALLRSHGGRAIWLRAGRSSSWPGWPAALAPRWVGSLGAT